MAIHAGTGFIDLLPRINAAAFTAAANTQLAPVATKTSQSLSAGFAAGFKKALVPIGATAAGLAALQVGKLTLDFEAAFTRIAALSNASAEQIRSWRSEVFELGQETAIAPQKLADALFFLASAGLDANQIFPALTASAKASAVGLGEVAEVARLTANVLNAYPDSGLKAIDVIDALTAAVREGTAEPDEFADALGRILPISAKAGVSIQEVVASLAALSNIGLDVDEGVTGVRQVLNLLVAPGNLASKALAAVGLSAEDLRESLAEGGIIKTLRLLEEATGGDEDAMRDILPNIRAMTAAFGLTEQEAAKLDAMFRRVANSSGDTGKALDETQAGPMFKFQRAMITLQEVAIRLGQVFLPLGTTIVQAFTSILGPIADLLGLMTQIPGATTAITVALLGFAAVKFVPLLLTGIANALFAISSARLGTAALGLAEFASALKTLGPAALRAAAPLALIPAAVFKLGQVTGERQAQAFTGLKDHIRTVGLEAAETDGSLVQLRKTVARQAGVGFRLPSTTEQREAVRKDFEKLTGTLDRETRAAAIAKQGIEDFQEQLKNGQPGLQRAARSLAAITDQNFNEFSASLKNALAAGVVDTKNWGKFVSETMGKASEAIAEFKDEAFQNLNFTAGALQELSSAATSAQEELETADLSVMDADDIRNLREAADLTAGELLRSFKEARRETREFGKDLLLISKTGGVSGERVAEVLLGMGEAGQAAADTIASAGPKMREALVNNFAAGEGAAETLANKLTRRIVGTLNQIRDILDALAQAWGIDVDTEGAEEAETKLGLILTRMREIDGTTATVKVSAIFQDPSGVTSGGTGFDPRQTAAGGVLGAQHGGITRRPTLLAGEGKYHTPFGKGAESILPLDDNTMGRLGSSIARHIRLPMIVVEADGEAIGRVVTRQQRRRRSLVGA